MDFKKNKFISVMSISVLFGAIVTEPASAGTFFEEQVEGAKSGISNFFHGLDKVVRDSLPADSPSAPGHQNPPAFAKQPQVQELSRDQVREIQLLLTRLGYAPGPADGLSGTNTRLAVQQYQSNNGLTVNGQMSFALLQDLRRATSLSNQAATGQSPLSGAQTVSSTAADISAAGGDPWCQRTLEWAKSRPASPTADGSLVGSGSRDVARVSSLISEPLYSSYFGRPYLSQTPADLADYRMHVDKCTTVPVDSDWWFLKTLVWSKAEHARRQQLQAMQASGRKSTDAKATADAAQRGGVFCLTCARTEPQQKDSSWETYSKHFLPKGTEVSIPVAQLNFVLNKPKLVGATPNEACVAANREAVAGFGRMIIEDYGRSDENGSDMDHNPIALRPSGNERGPFQAYWAKVRHVVIPSNQPLGNSTAQCHGWVRIDSSYTFQRGTGGYAGSPLHGWQDQAITPEQQAATRGTPSASGEIVSPSNAGLLAENPSNVPPLCMVGPGDRLQVLQRQPRQRAIKVNVLKAAKCPSHTVGYVSEQLFASASQLTEQKAARERLLPVGTEFIMIAAPSQLVLWPQPPKDGHPAYTAIPGYGKMMVEAQTRMNEVCMPRSAVGRYWTLSPNMVDPDTPQGQRMTWKVIGYRDITPKEGAKGTWLQVQQVHGLCSGWLPNGDAFRGNGEALMPRFALASTWRNKHSAAAIGSLKACIEKCRSAAMPTRDKAGFQACRKDCVSREKTK